MRNLITIIFALAGLAPSIAQVVTTDPFFPKPDQPLTITVDVTGTSLNNYAWNNTTNPVWIWTWIAEGCSSGCDAPTNIDPATAAQDAAKVTKISTGPDKYQITFTPTTFFNKSAAQIKKIGLKLKTRNWSDNKQTDNDKFITFTEGFEVAFSQPTLFPIFKNQGEQITIIAHSSEVADLTLKIGGTTISSAPDATSISYTHTISESSGTSTVLIQADNGATVKEASFIYVVRSATVNAARPAGIIDGINYSSDHTKVTLSVWAPNKTSAYAFGDFSDWNVLQQYQMKKDGEHFWVEITGLTPGQEYGFQYLIDETLRIADPYADKILDPDDKFIPASTYPGLKTYPAKALTDKWYFNRVSVFQTNQSPYVWQTTNYQKPAKKDLVIYEALVRDLFADGQRNYQNLIDTISYIKKLGANAIQLMPIMEFAGNDSWGYNPTFMFAPDKYYGTKNKLKEFIDKCHQEGIAVILDIAMNHQDTPNPYILLDFNYTTFKPNPTNPWFNVNATHPFSVFFDMNHESSYTKAYLDTVNHYWLSEYKIDGYRFDLSKGFTQKNTGSDVGAWSAKDDTRIALLKRMADKIRAKFPDAILILEHLADNTEEKILADYGFLMWGNMNGPFSQAAMGFGSNSDLAWADYTSRNWNDANLIAYMESHDEERMMYRNLQFGNSSGGYSVKNLNTALERIKAAATLYFSIPGPKMLWQFGELGYDISIDFNGRVGAKPVKWDYYSNASRNSLFEHFADMIALKKSKKIFETSDITIEGGNSLLKQLTLRNNPFIMAPKSQDEMNAQIVVNFDLSAKNVQVNFSHTGTWYSYFDDEIIQVTQLPFSLSLPAGAYRLFTDYPINTVTGTEPKTGSSIQVFPNGMHDRLFINSRENVIALSMITVQGKKIGIARENTTTWDVSELPPGLYIACISTSKGSFKVRVVKH